MRTLTAFGLVVLITLSYGLALNGGLKYSDYKGDQSHQINGDIMRTANYLFSKQTHDLEESAAEIERAKSEAIQAAIDRYAKYSEELGQMDIRKKYPIPISNPRNPRK